MKRPKHYLVVLAILFCNQIVFGQTRSDRLLDTPVSHVRFRAESIEQILSKVATNYKVPIGLESALAGGEGLEIEINIEAGTLRDVLDAAIHRDVRYDWKFVEGVINVYPKVQRDEFLEELLKTRLRSFVVDKKTGVWDIRVNITELPEVKAKLDSAHVEPVIAAWMTPNFAEARPGFTISLHDVTLRELLNQLVKTSDTKLWVIRRYGDRYQYLTLNF